MSEDLQSRGNDFFKSGNLQEAIHMYTDAIAIKPTPQLFSNRSLCHFQRNSLVEALEDAERCVALDGKFVKGYYRQASALYGLERYADALSSVDKALEIEPSNKEVQELKQTILKRNNNASVVGRVELDTTLCLSWDQNAEEVILFLELPLRVTSDKIETVVSSSQSMRILIGEKYHITQKLSSLWGEIDTTRKPKLDVLITTSPSTRNYELIAITLFKNKSGVKWDLLSAVYNSPNDVIKTTDKVRQDVMTEYLMKSSGESEEEEREFAEVTVLPSKAFMEWAITRKYKK
eukprot:PhF_6_TR38762/c1_g1_i2/m.58038